MWRIIILGPADLERSIVESGLKQADLKVAVMRSNDEALLILEALDADALLVLGDTVDSEKEPLDFAGLVYPAAKRAGIAVLRVGSETGLPAEVLSLKRPLKFPAAAVEIARQIRSFYATQLGPDNELDADGLRLALLRCEKVAVSGVMQLDAGQMLGSLHFDRGGVTHVGFGVLSGAEALANMLKVSGVTLSFDEAAATQPGAPRRVGDLLREADAIELQIGQLLAAGPQEPLKVVPDRLLQRMGILNDQIAWVLRLLDGRRDLAAVRLIGGVRAVEGVLSLLEDGIITTTGGVSAAPPEALGEGLQGAPEPVDIDREPDTDWIEEDFAWSIALGDVPEGIGNPSNLAEEGDEVRWDDGSEAFKGSDWDPLPAFSEDAALADAGALFDAGRTGPTESGLLPLPPSDQEFGIEPMLGGGNEMVEPQGSLPPVAEDGEVGHGFTDSGEPAEAPADPHSWAEEQGLVDPSDEPPVSDVSRGFESSPQTGTGTGTGTGQSQRFGGGFGSATGTDYHDGGDHQSLLRPASKRLPPALRLILLAVVMGLTMVYVMYKRQSRIQAVGLPVVQQRVRYAPKLTPRPGRGVERTDSQEIKKTRKSRRRRRLRRRKKGSRARLRAGVFAKRMAVARALRDDGDIDGSIVAFTQAFASKITAGEKAIALAERGEARLSNGEAVAAKVDLQQAIALDARNGSALKTLGFIEYQAFKSNDPTARARALGLLEAYLSVADGQDPGVNRWLRELR